MARLLSVLCMIVAFPSRRRCGSIALRTRALAHHVYYGRQGQTDGRDLQQQMSRASCLVCILAALIYWHILQIDGVLQHWDPTADGIDLALLTHISPIGWDNVVLYGEYHLDRSLVRHPPRITGRSVEH